MKASSKYPSSFITQASWGGQHGKYLPFYLTLLLCWYVRLSHLFRWIPSSSSSSSSRRARRTKQTLRVNSRWDEMKIKSWCRLFIKAKLIRSRIFWHKAVSVSWSRQMFSVKTLWCSKSNLCHLTGRRRPADRASDWLVYGWGERASFSSLRSWWRPNQSYIESLYWKASSLE